MYRGGCDLQRSPVVETHIVENRSMPTTPISAPCRMNPDSIRFPTHSVKKEKHRERGQHCVDVVQGTHGSRNIGKPGERRANQQEKEDHEDRNFRQESGDHDPSPMDLPNGTHAVPPKAEMLLLNTRSGFREFHLLQG